MNDRASQLEAVLGSVSRETYERFVALEAIFRKWAARINLVAPSTVEATWQRHIIDSVQIFPLARGAKSWVDLGSGGGFPGLAIAVLLSECPAASIDLIESNKKKCAFLQAATRELNLPAKVHAKRIEDVVAGLVPREIVSARALAPLSHLFELALPLFRSGARGLFHKGRDYQREVEESCQNWSFDLVRHASVLDADSVILEISNVRRRQA